LEKASQVEHRQHDHRRFNPELHAVDKRISAEHFDSRRTMITLSISVIIRAPVIYFLCQFGDGQ
jgi:hypothetical protein